MGIIKISLKYGIPVGVVYYTIREGYWSSTRPETLKAHTEQVNRGMSVVKQYIHMPESVQNTDFASLWNTGVKKTMRAIADFNPKEAAATIQNKLQSSTSQSTSSKSENKSTSQGADASSSPASPSKDKK